MSLTRLLAANHRRMPWKNGRGETTEIAVWPEGAGLQDFGWRLSMAGVSEHGAFSAFPGSTARWRCSAAAASNWRSRGAAATA